MFHISVKSYVYKWNDYKTFNIFCWNAWFKNIEIDLFCQFQILTFLSFMLFNLNCQSIREDEGIIIMSEEFSSFVIHYSINEFILDGSI